MIQPVAQSQPSQQLDRALAPRMSFHAGIDRRQFDIGASGQTRQQMVALKNKAKVLAAQGGQRIGIEFIGLMSGHPISSRRGPVEAAQNVHQGRFPRSGAAYDGNHFTRFDAQVDISQGNDGLLPRRVFPAQRP